MLIALAVLVWVTMIVLAIMVDRRLQAMLERGWTPRAPLERAIKEALDEHDQMTPQPFTVGDRVDVDVDDVPLLTETRVHKLLERAKDNSRWAR